VKRAGRASLAATAVWMGIVGDPAAGRAEIRIGVTLPLTGPLATLHIQARDEISAWPKSIAGETVTVILTDDGGDPGTATGNARRLLAEGHVDVLVSSPVFSLAVATVASENHVAHLVIRSAAPFAPRQPAVIQRRESLPTLIFEHMKANKVVKVGLIGFSDSWGDLWIGELQGSGARLDLRLVAEERYGRADSSVAVQSAKLVAARPDAILVAASGSASLLPQLALRELGFLGPIYHTHDTATNDFIRRAGHAANNTFLPATDSLVAEIKAKQPFEIGAAGGQGIDVGEVLKQHVPVALQAGRPGTSEFRVALRKAAQETMASMGKPENDATAGDKRVWILVAVKDGQWTLAK
jgi:branched-chain amino acid transport system substrate-binding protein